MRPMLPSSTISRLSAFFLSRPLKPSEITTDFRLHKCSEATRMGCVIAECRGRFCGRLRRQARPDDGRHNDVGIRLVNPARTDVGEMPIGLRVDSVLSSV